MRVTRADSHKDDPQTKEKDHPDRQRNSQRACGKEPTAPISWDRGKQRGIPRGGQKNKDWTVSSKVKAWLARKSLLYY